MTETTMTTESANDAATRAALTAMRLPQLQAIASQLGVKGISRMRKSDLLAAIREAKSHGDLRENAAYHEAKLNQARLDSRIADLEKLLQIAKVVEGGSAAYASIRGAEAKLNSVTLDGQRITATPSGSGLDASNSADTRAVDLSLIPSELVGGIELIKALTPETAVKAASEAAAAGTAPRQRQTASARASTALNLRFIWFRPPCRSFSGTRP